MNILYRHIKSLRTPSLACCCCCCYDG